MKFPWNKRFLKVFACNPIRIGGYIVTVSIIRSQRGQKGQTTDTTPTALEVAYFLLRKGGEDGRAISNKKLQKLLYYAQAWTKVMSGERLFDDPIEAWVHGPAIRDVYREFKDFDFGPINPAIIPSEEFDFGDKRKTLDEVWQVYGKYDANYLEMLTHSEEPWIEARNGLEINENSSNEISLDTMYSFYAKILEEAQKQTDQ